MRRLAVLLLPLLLAPATLAGDDLPRPAAASPVLLTEVYYNATRGDEYVVVSNPAAYAVDLTGWYLSDGEGTASLPDGLILAGRSRIVLAENSTAYEEATLAAADLTWRDGAAPLLNTSGAFQLANYGDALTLHDASGAVVDAVVWGNAAYSGPGWDDAALTNASRGQVLRRHKGEGTLDPFVDTNTTADWTALPPRYVGQVDFPPDSVTATATVEAFASPGRTLEVLERYLEWANESLRIGGYTFTSLELRDALLAAVARGVEVQLLLEAEPVGGMTDREWGIAQNLSAAGAAVRFMGVADDDLSRYPFHHAKYAVIDDRIALVGSENWGESGFPPSRGTGNRGWHVAVHDELVAGYLADVFDRDFDDRRRDTFAMGEMAATPVPYASEPQAPYAWDVEPLAVTGTVDVTPMIGPEQSFYTTRLLGLLRGATERVYVQQFYARPQWSDGPNLFLQELLDAARRGVAVKLLLDSTWYNVEGNDTNDNDDAIAWLRGIAENESLPLEAKLTSPEAHDVVKYHNKGVVVDGAAVLVSSMNWNEFSPTRNREVGLIVRNAAVAGYFEDLFLHDWKDDATPPTAGMTGPPGAVAGDAFVLSAAGSSDDVAVVNWSWDFEDDGTADAYGPLVEHTYPVPGNYTVRLVVRDAWGNSASTARLLEVSGEGGPGQPPGGGSFPWLVVLLGAAGFALLMLLSILARRRRR